MRLIDRITLNRAIKLLIDFILRLTEILTKCKTIDNNKPSPVRPRPIKNIIDNIIPWRRK